jgi:ribonuclease HII
MNFKYEKEKYRQGYTYVIGCDEVGRGSLAGPVVACAVALDLRYKFEDLRLNEIKDSKLLTPKKREELAEAIKQNCVAYGIGAVEPRVIDEINIHQATLLAMRKAVEDIFTRHCECGPSDLSKKRDSLALGCTLAREEKYFLYLDGK